MTTVTDDDRACRPVRAAVRNCPACAGTRVEVVHRLALRTPDGHPLGGGYEVVSCVDCGTGFADVDPPSTYYDEYYASAAKYATEHRSTGPAVREPAWVLRRFAESADRLAGLLPDRAARILDIGCANGTLLAAMKARGYPQVCGVDPSPESAGLARDRHDVTVRTGTFSDLPPLGGSFDAITLTGVLEHLWDVDEAMTAVLSLLDREGLVYVEVPDASRYGDPYIAPFQDFSTEHVNHFSPATLDRLARRFGLTTATSVPADSDLADGVPCATVAVTWRRATGAGGGPAGGRDLALVDSLREFAARSAVDFAGIDARLERQLAGADGFVVWGFGELTMKLLALPALRSRTLLGIVDSNPSRQGFRYGDLRVAPPAADRSATAPVVVGSLLSHDAIVDHLAARRLANPVVRLND